MSSTDSAARLARGSSVAGAAVAVALLASACGSSGGSGGGAAAGGGASGGASATVVVESHSGPMGTFLTDSSGRSLYMFAVDTPKKSACSGTCLVYWPPLTAKGAVKGADGVASSKLGTITGSDGSKQVTYAGHPLYYYRGDTAPGDTTGEGNTKFGGRWWLLSSSGAPITSRSGGSAGGGASSSSSSSSGGGGGAWG